MEARSKKRQKLDDEIAGARNEIRTDKLDISYGELANLYENNELIIRPEYQRLFRWNQTQKARFVESILLGFPTPAIFVAEDARGVWELVDGLQRVSTILEFLGLLKDPNGNFIPPSRLVKAGRKPRLPSIEGALFKELSLKARLSIKRAGCRVEVIKTGSKPTMKYEVFERLNTGGFELTPQEVRNCIFRATNPDFVEWIERLADHPPFKENLCLSEFQENTMFYAHWEGYVREVCQLYLEYIEATGTKVRELRADLLAYLWTSVLKPLAGGLDFSRKKLSPN